MVISSAFTSISAPPVGDSSVRVNVSSFSGTCGIKCHGLSTLFCLGITWHLALLLVVLNQHDHIPVPVPVPLYTLFPLESD